MDCGRIVIIEDDEDIRDTLSLALEFEGYTVLSASNGKEGIALLERCGAPCLILLDLMMPVMNGWEFLRERNSSDALSPVPVIVVSAFADETSDHTVQAFLRKPVDLDTLLKMVSRYCH
jgi:CheY-like chemotaxis protein